MSGFFIGVAVGALWMFLACVSLGLVGINDIEDDQ